MKAQVGLFILKDETAVSNPNPTNPIILKSLRIKKTTFCGMEKSFSINNSLLFLSVHAKF